MKIRQSLALRFTLVSALLTGLILIFIYTITRRYVHEDFITRLTKQSSLEVLHFASPHAKDLIPPGSFMLINPVTSIFDKEGNLLYTTGGTPTHSKWLKNLNPNDVLHLEEGDYTTVGKMYVIAGKKYLVFVSDKDLPGQNELNIFMNTILAGWLISIILSYLAGLYFSGRALKPFKKVVNEVNQVTKDSLSYRLSLKDQSENPDEIGELVITFNALLDRIESAFIAQKRFVQHASHEIKTPLTAIMGEAELALVKDRDITEYKRTLSVVVSETERLVNITQGLLTLSRFEEGYYNTEMEEVDVALVMRDAIHSFQIRYPDRKLIGTDLQSVTVECNSQLLLIAFSNLIDNAFKYSQEDVTVTIKKKKDHAVIRISDRGIGIPAPELSKVKLPMFRATNVHNIPGAGLGLSLVQRIVEVHHGSIDIESNVNQGTTSIVILPISLKR